MDHQGLLKERGNPLMQRRAEQLKKKKKSQHTETIQRPKGNFTETINFILRDKRNN